MKRVYLRNDKKWSCNLVSFNLKNEKFHLKTDKKWSYIAGFSLLFKKLSNFTHRELENS